MTVVAYRDGVMASDSINCVGDANVGSTPKIVRSEHGFLGGAAGDSGDCDRWLIWVAAGFPAKGFIPADAENFGALLVAPDGVVKRMGLKGALYEIEAPFHAMGVGREVAMGAMAAGASAERAVQIAIDLVSGCGGPVQVVRTAE